MGRKRPLLTQHKCWYFQAALVVVYISGGHIVSSSTISRMNLFVIPEGSTLYTSSMATHMNSSRQFPGRPFGRIYNVWPILLQSDLQSFQKVAFSTLP